MECGGNGYAIPTQVVEGKTIEKPFESWSVDEIRRVEYKSKAMNIIHSSLNCDEFSRCQHVLRQRKYEI